MGVKQRPSVCFLSGCNAGTTFEYRVLQKQEQLAHYGFQSVAQQDLSYGERTLREALSHDLLYLYRVAYSPFVEELIQQARARRIPVIFGTDDLVFEPELVHRVDPLRSMSHDRAALYYQGVWRYRQTLLACDYVVTSTEYLADLARAHGKEVFVHRNGLSQWMIDAAEDLVPQRLAQPERDTVVIGYGSGTDTHRKDMAEIANVLAEMLSRYPNVELHVGGPMTLPGELTRFGEQVKHLPLVEWHEWLATLSTFDVNLAPLESDNPFCHAKSEVKYTEAALLGIPTVASRTDAFEFAIRDGETGFLADSAEEWTVKLERLLADPALRRRLAEAARADVLARYTPAVLGQELVQTLETVQQHHAQQQASALAAAPDPRATPLVLNWVFPEPMPGSGGHTNIIRMMNLLASFGHQINAYVEPRTGKSDLGMREFIRRHFADPDWCLFKWTGEPMVESDATFVTYWKMAYLINDVNNAAPVFYFVQDWEPFFFSMSTDYLRAEQTYRMGFSCITLGRWLTEFLRHQYDADADYFDLAVDHEIYYPRPVAKRDRPRVCFYARPSTPRRLFPIGVEALQLIHQRRPDVEIVLYGAEDDELRSYAIPFPYTNRGILKEHELAELFSASDVGIVLSSTNCSLVPPEMMACKCAVVDLNREMVHGVLEHEVNALLAEPTPQAIADAALRLLDDEPLRQRLVETAYQQVQRLSWAKSARRAEEILYRKLPPSRRVSSPHRFTVQPGLPARADLPPGQRKHLDAIHDQRRRVGTQWSTRFKELGRRLRQGNPEWTLGKSPVRMLGDLYGRRSVGQSFVARRDNLHRIDVLITTYGRHNTRDVILHLRESPTSDRDLATARLNASMLVGTSYARFTFEPQPGSRGKSYYFCIESPESVPGDAIALWAYRQADLPDAQLYRNGHTRKGHLVFGLFYLDDHLGEVGERPFQRGLGWRVAHWSRLKKAYRLLSSLDLPRLWREVEDYWKWRTGQV